LFKKTPSPKKKKQEPQQLEDTPNALPNFKGVFYCFASMLYSNKQMGKMQHNVPSAYWL